MIKAKILCRQVLKKSIGNYSNRGRNTQQHRGVGTLMGLAYCKTEQQAQELLAELKHRFEECGLELHPEKTKIIYCKDGSRKGLSENGI